jgi:hypothetical protein
VITKPFLLRAPGSTPPGQEPKPGDDKVGVYMCVWVFPFTIRVRARTYTCIHLYTHTLTLSSQTHQSITITAHRPDRLGAARFPPPTRENHSVGSGHGHGVIVDCGARLEFCGHPGICFLKKIYRLCVLHRSNHPLIHTYIYMHVPRHHQPKKTETNPTHIHTHTTKTQNRWRARARRGCPSGWWRGSPR